MIRMLCSTAALIVALAAPVAAQTLTIIDETGDAPVTHEFTIEEIEALGSAEIATETVWTEGEIVFTGVPASALLEFVEGDFDQVEATALNDFSVFLPVSDFAADANVLIATRADGELMSVRDRGPFWVMFDFDELEGSVATAAEQRSIWQLSSLTFR